MKKIGIALLLVTLSACQKENNDPVLQQDPIYTGIANENMYSEDLESGFSLPYNWTECGMSNSIDSIDLFADGSFDILLEGDFLNSNLFFSSECCPPPMDCMPVGMGYSIRLKNGYEVACYDTTTNDINSSLVSILSLNTQIDTINNWSTSTYFWTYYFDLYGPWYMLESDKYVAIRKAVGEKYKYGWIKIGPYEYGNLIFKEYAHE